MKWVLRVVVGLVVVLAVVAGGGYLWLRTSLPEVDGEIVLKGPRDEIKIVRDINAIPHIFAKSSEDAFFALGFVHAQDRLWQMEMNRRIGAGRLSEIFGVVEKDPESDAPSLLDTDRFLRTLGVYRQAEKSVANLDAETRAILDAYAAGVNAQIAYRDALPPEFIILRHEPEPWKAADSVVWTKMMAWDLGANWRSELMRLRLAKQLGTERMRELYPPYPGETQPALPDFAALYNQLDLRRFAAASPKPLPRGTGSNNWVLNGSRTAHGQPLLANDPHLGLAAPAIWYFAHLNAPDMNVIGATLPGVPAVVLGRNDRVAWGFTNTGPDVQDLFIEQIDPADPNRYRTPDGWANFEIVTETIRIKGADPVDVKVRISRHGPIITDSMQGTEGYLDKGFGLAFAWTALLPDDKTPAAIAAMTKVKSGRDFVEAMRTYHAPQQNMVYADVDGNIGLIAPARIPVRKPENLVRGRMPVPGWEAVYDWDGFLPYEELPQRFNPGSGAIWTANHKIVPDDYRHFLTYDWTPPYRARRIGELLDASPAHSVASFQRMQGDVRSTMARDFLPLMLKVEPVTASARRVHQMLTDWDGTMDRNLAEPLIFNAWYRELIRMVLEDDLGPDLFEDFWGMRPLVMYDILTNPNGQARWCDDIHTQPAEPCNVMLLLSLDKALADLEARYGTDRAKWRWGDAHIAHSDHRPFTGQPVLGDLFDIKVPSDGDTFTVNVGRNSIEDDAAPFTNVHAASLRAIYDFENLNRSLFIHSTGQSGNPLSDYYRNFAVPWSNLEYLPMTTDPADFQAGAIGTLTLSPQLDG